MAASFGKSSYAVRKTLKGFDYERKVAKKKPFISKMNKRKIFKWANQLLKKHGDFWKQVIWSDESKLFKFLNSGRVYVWRRTDESWKSECLQVTMKRGEQGIIVWGAILSEGRSPLIFI